MMKTTRRHFIQCGITGLAVVNVLAVIGFDKWAQLECDAPSGSVEADMSKNLSFIRNVIAQSK